MKSLWRHSSQDAWLVGITGLTISLLCVPYFMRLPGFTLLLLNGLIAVLICFNYQCIAHNFIHNPFFHSSTANSWFSAANTICLGMPQIAYRFHHLNHHRYNNARIGDRSSTHRYGRAGAPEHVLKYSLYGVVRLDWLVLYREARSRGRHRVFVFEFCLLGGVLLVMAACNWSMLLLSTVPAILLGQSLSLLQNYAEHAGGQPGRRGFDAVSCYNQFYNKVCCNNGFHQEHHMLPRVHWTRIPEYRLHANHGHRIVENCHVYGLFNLEFTRESGDKTSRS